MNQMDNRNLRMDDIKFLKGIAEIERNPNEVPDTGLTEAPANTSSLRHITDLSKRQIQYRIQPDERGFEELGYVRLYGPDTLEGGGLGPRSVELTDKGRKAIMDWEKRHGEMDHEDLTQATKEELKLEIADLRGELDKLRARFELADGEKEGISSGEDVSFGGDGEVDVKQEFGQIRSRLDALSDRVEEIEDDPWGAVDDSKVGEIKRTKQLAVGAIQLFAALGVDAPEEAHQQDYDHASAVRDIRERLDMQGNEAETDEARTATGEQSTGDQKQSEQTSEPRSEQRTSHGGDESEGPPPIEEVDDPFDRLHDNE